MYMYVSVYCVYIERGGSLTVWSQAVAGTRTVCMYVCMYVCVYVYMYVCVSVYVRMYVWTYVCMYE